MTTNLENIASIQKEISRLKRKAAQISRHQKAKIIADIIKMIRSNDIDLGDIERALNSRQNAPQSSAEIKYRHPDGSTWTGRGRAPGWIKAADTAGQSRDIYRVTDQEAEQQ
ncbi:H-NS histone family protein [Alcaligenes sp. 13f]|uniref:H-NS histone family protein n=1 Tax=Alcaligenes sp. 13f TaxID=2841924 RepID=UPI001CF6951F|nr:H-NS histone family protein [Alcaligenes sp. 13f]MCB4321477.1 H-NS histone family protein [Alcaligenes sp. 13f]